MLPLMIKTYNKGWVYRPDVETLVQITHIDYPATTVPGIVFLDGTFYVMDSYANIWGSIIYDSDPVVYHPEIWDSLNVITAESEPDGGVAITKYLNYLLAFGYWTTEFFYTVPVGIGGVGSNLQRAENLFLQIGCADARSIQQCDNSVIWMAQTKENEGRASAGRTIVQLQGTQTNVISNYAVNRLLDADGLADVYSMSLKTDGHTLYILTLLETNITLVYDLDLELWYQWTSLTQQAPKSVTGITRSGTTATANIPGHGYSDGDVVVFAGADQIGYNLSTNVTFIDANHVSYEVVGNQTTPATGTITATGYTEGCFSQVFHTTLNGVNLFSSLTGGVVYSFGNTYHSDAGTPINFMVRTTKIDNNDNNIKKFSKAEIIGDKVAGNALFRYSKDDYQTYSKYRKCDLSLQRSYLARIGQARRASFDIRVTDNVPIRLERLQITVGDGKE